MDDIGNDEPPVRPKLCYISVVALFLAIFPFFTPSVARGLIILNILAFVIATVSLIRIKTSTVKLRGKGLAIAAFVISLAHMLFLFVILALKRFY